MVKKVQKPAKLGKPLKASNKFCCLTCGLYSKCTDTHKRFDYRCSLWEKQRKTALNFDNIAVQVRSGTEELDDDIENNSRAKKSKDTYVERDNENFNIEKLIDTLIEEQSKNPIPRDLRIDDRDLPLADNFLDFCVNPLYMSGVTPYARQIETGLRLFGEYNPNKTNMKWFNDIPVDATPDDFYDNVCLLKHGICPKTKITKHELFTSGQLTPWIELGACWGQRSGKCLEKNTYILTINGPKKLGELAKLHPKKEGFSTYQGPPIVLESGIPVNVSKFYRSKKEVLYKLTTSNGISIIGTAEHPMWTKRGWIKLPEITANDVIPVAIGQNVWGHLSLSYKELWSNARKTKRAEYYSYSSGIQKSLYTKFGQSLFTNPKTPRSGRITTDIAMLLGFWVAEGSGTTISNNDPKVLEFCYKTFVSLYGKKDVFRNNRGVSIKQPFNRTHFNCLLEEQYSGRSANRFIPKHILSSPKTIVTAFLQTLFEGDGGLEGGAITYCSLSKELIQQISVLLHNIGIPHKLDQFWTWATNGSPNQVSKRGYRVIIYGLSALETFAREINFFSERKIKALQTIIIGLKNRTLNMPFWYEKYPEAVKQEFLAILAEIDQEMRQFKVYVPGRGNILPHKNYSLGIFFDDNSEFGRIYEDNVALSKRRMISYQQTIMSHKFSRMLSPYIVNKLASFVREYSDPNTYWVEASVRKLRRKAVTYDITVPKYHRFLANGLLSHNSALSGAMIFPYLTHNYLKMQNLAKIYRLLPRQTLHGTFVALTYVQARDTLWDPYYEAISESPWFSQYHALLNHYGIKYSEELYKFKDTFLHYRVRNLYVYPTGPDRRKLRGRTRAFAAVDEMGWFESSQGSDSIKYSADEIYTALKNSLSTLSVRWLKLVKEQDNYNNVLPPIFANISSPSSQQDKMMELIRIAKTSKEILGMHYPTWEVNPDLPFSSFRDRMKSDRIKFWRDFGAVPPLSASPFIESLKSVKNCVGKNENAAKIEQYRFDLKGSKFISGTLKWNWKDKTTPKLMAIDMGQVDNHFAIIIGHYDTEQEMPIYDFVGELIPLGNRALSFTSIYQDILSELIDELNVVMVVADQWQQIKMLNDILANHDPMLTDKFSIKRENFDEFKSDLLEQRFRLPRAEMKKLSKVKEFEEENYPKVFLGKPVSHLVFQCLAVEDQIRTVTKGEKSTDDLFRALVLAHRFLIDDEVKDMLAGCIGNKGPLALVAIAKGGSGQNTSSQYAVRATTGMGGGNSSSNYVVSSGGRNRN